MSTLFRIGWHNSSGSLTTDNDFIIHNNGFLKTKIWTLEARCWREKAGDIGLGSVLYQVSGQELAKL